MELSRKSKNQEILENPKIKANLEKGHVVVLEISDTRNDEYNTLFLVQYIENNNNSQLSNAQAALLGWNKQLDRCVTNAAVEQIQGIEVGDSLNEKLNMDFCIQINDTYTPDPNFNHTPRATRDGELLVEATSGKEIYRHKTLTTKDVLEHTFLKTVVKSDYNTKAVSKESVMTSASV